MGGSGPLTGPSVAFGDCLLDGRRRLLSRKGEEAHLTPKAFALLELLLLRRPAVVTKQEIMQLLWPDTFVVEANVPNLIAEVRQAIGDPPERSRLIRTVHRVGYSFCGRVETVTESSPDQESLSGFSLILDGRVLPLAPGSNVVGRGEDCQIQLDSQTVSRRHAEITVGDDSVTITDLGSKNGTLVRGGRVRGVVPVKAGDEIRFGEISLRLEAASRNARTKTFSMEDMLRLPQDGAARSTAPVGVATVAHRRRPTGRRSH